MECYFVWVPIIQILHSASYSCSPIFHARIVQGADWHFGASNQNPNQPQYIKDAALATFIICTIFFFLYLALQVRKNCVLIRIEALYNYKMFQMVYGTILLGEVP